MNSETLLAESKRIDEVFEQIESKSRDEISSLNKQLEEANERKQIALIDGDLRENASYESAIKDIQRIQSDIRLAESQLSGVEVCRQEMVSYSRTSRISVFSTVHLKLSGELPKDPECQILKKEYTFKIFMAGVSDTKNGILAAESEVGRMLIGKAVGDKIRVRHKLSGASVEYEITNFV